MTKKFLQKIFVKQNIPIFLILIFAAFMRLYKIDEYLIFLGDEGRDVLVAKHILEGDLTLLGPTASVGGFFLGPIYYYMMAPFLWLFNYNPVGPAVMVALFGVATVWLVYKVTKDFFGFYPGIAASLLYAVSPLVILYSRSSWNPNTVPFFALLMFYTLYKAFLKRSKRLFFFVGILLGILLQLHYLTTFLAVVIFVTVIAVNIFENPNDIKSRKSLLSILVFLCLMGLGIFVLGIFWPSLSIVLLNSSPGVLVSSCIVGFLGIGLLAFSYFVKLPNTGKKMPVIKSSVKELLIVLAGFIVGWSPFLLFEARHGFSNTRSILRFILDSGDTGGNEKYFWIAQDVFMRGFGRLLLAFPRIEDIELYSDKLLELWGFSAYVIGIICVTFCVYRIALSLKKKNDTFYKYTVLLLWLIICILLFGFYKKPIYDYYLGLLYPVPFILVGGLISLVIKKDASFSKQSKVWMVVIAITVLSLTVLNYSFRQFRFPGNHQLAQVEGIADFVLSKTNGKPYNFAVISSGGNSDYAYRYFFEKENKPPVTIQFPGADPERESITDQLLIVCESNPCHPLGYSLWEVAGFGQAEIIGEWPVSVLKVYKLKHYKP